MNFSKMVDLLSVLAKTNSRNEMTELLAQFLGETAPHEMRETCYLILGQLGPLFARIDFGVAEKMAMRSIARVSDLSPEAVMQLYKERGDLGELVEGVKSRVSSVQSMTVHEVYERLMAIATASGEGSQEVKIDLLATLLSQSSPVEAKFLVRMVLGKMRLGFSDKTILDALAVMDNGSKQGREALDLAYQVSPDIGAIATLVKTVGVNKVALNVVPQIGVPVMPALAQRLKTAAEMIKKMGKVLVEPKFDGTRVEIHYQAPSSNNQVPMIKSYARSLEENSAQYPELIEGVKQLNAESVILDCEAVGYDPTTGKMASFQETITRKRKHGVAAASESLPLRFYCFDILFKNGENLLAKPLFERRTILAETILPGEVLVVDASIETDDPDVLRNYHAEQLAQGLEGALVKKYDGEYCPGRTGWNWVKFKEVEDSSGKLSDTIDGVVMGYYKGKGKRSGFGIGAFLLGILKDNVYVSVAKVGTGLTDEQWREMKRRVDCCFSLEKPTAYQVADGLHPDIWADPSIVVEVAADEVTASPMHSSGWSLRFPRLERFRDDKRADQATSVEELLSIK